MAIVADSALDLSTTVDDLSTQPGFASPTRHGQYYNCTAVGGASLSHRQLIDQPTGMTPLAC